MFLGNGLVIFCQKTTEGDKENLNFLNNRIIYVRIGIKLSYKHKNVYRLHVFIKKYLKLVKFQNKFCFIIIILNICSSVWCTF